MVTYKCFQCGKKVKNNVLDKRFICINCDGKIFYKPRTQVMKIKAI